MLGAAVVLGGALWKWPRAPEPPSFKQVTFRRANIAEARFAPDGQTIVYGAAVEGRHNRLFSARLGSPEVRALDLPDGDIAAISASGDMAIVLSHSYNSRVPGTLARVSLAGGAPRDLAEKVSMADWGPDGRDLAVVRHDGVKRRLEYPIGKVLYESDTADHVPPRFAEGGSGRLPRGGRTARSCASSTSRERRPRSRPATGDPCSAWPGLPKATRSGSRSGGSSGPSPSAATSAS